MLKRNELKNLIYIQENKLCNEQTIKGLFRSIVEPILDTNTQSLVLLRLEDKSKKDFNSVLKRLEYSNAKIYDFSDTPLENSFENILKDKIWDKTEFVYVLAERFGSALIFDYEEPEMENFAQFYVLHNSKNLSEIFKIINSNSTLDLKSYEDQWHPDRRDNEILNLSIRKIVENLNETNQEMLISQLENEETDTNEDVVPRLEFLLAKSSYIAHEMRNLLSICNLYSDIIDRQADKISFSDSQTEESILNARECISKSLKMTNNLLLDFKSLRGAELKQHNLKYLTDSAIELSKVYANSKKIEFENKSLNNIDVLVDENKFLAVLINLIKNAIESIEQQGKIIVDTQEEENTVKIIISNDGKPINKDLQDKIFKEGFTTKSSGTGLGLAICNKTLEEQMGKLSLKKSDETSTEFEVILLKG